MTIPSEPTQQTPAADGAGDAFPVWAPSLPGVEPANSPADVVAPAAIARPGHARRASSVTALLVIGAIVAACGIGFAAGRATSTGQTGTSGTGTGQTGGGAPAGLGVGLGPGGFDPRTFGIDVAMTGTVVSVTSESITIKLADGQTTTIATGASTTYHEQNSTTSASVSAGQTVSVKVNGSSGRPDDLNPASSPGAGAGAQTATDVTITAK
ncbi:MAG TPA: hypothetical protein VIK32_13730 [Candidatus Limnocylindrales bacterium]